MFASEDQMIHFDKDRVHRLITQVRGLPRNDRLKQLIARQKLSLLLMIVGLGLLAYVGHEYWTMHTEQQALQQRWQAQQHVGVVSSPAPAMASKDDGLTRVSIPKINLDLIVVEGTNHKALRLGPGHLKNTPLPGESGNSVISAHRDTFFRHIYELAKGDEIQVRRDGRTYTFQVIGKKIVEPDDLSVVKNTSDTRLTLITCYPIYYIGPAPQRLIVTARLIEGAQPSSQSAGTPTRTVAGQGS
ncbi:MAG: class D sortase [Acidobacteria bacterium]|nr:class D sortase [Acidobacteriota bacterium]